MNALCNLSRKKSQEVAASLPGRFLSRRCFTLCITMEAEPRIAKQHKNATTVAVAKITQATQVFVIVLVLRISSAN